MDKRTVGEEAVERLTNPDTKQGIVDTEREANKEYMPQIEKCIQEHATLDKPFYVVVHVKKEQLLENVMRRYFLARMSLPTPQWDQDVWRYDPSTGDLEYLWSLPDENTAKWMAATPLEVPLEQHDLRNFVLNFLDKKLFKHFYDKYHKEVKDEKDMSQTPYAKVCAKEIIT